MIYDYVVLFPKIYAFSSNLSMFERYNINNNFPNATDNKFL